MPSSDNLQIFSDFEEVYPPSPVDESNPLLIEVAAEHHFDVFLAEREASLGQECTKVVDDQLLTSDDSLQPISESGGDSQSSQSENDSLIMKQNAQSCFGVFQADMGTPMGQECTKGSCDCEMTVVLSKEEPFFPKMQLAFGMDSEMRSRMQNIVLGYSWLIWKLPWAKNAPKSRVCSWMRSRLLNILLVYFWLRWKLPWAKNAQNFRMSVS